jgi:DNA-binding transcriptional LysR family regulator
MNIDIGSLRAFCVVAEKESFTLAAEFLGATQSTISMRVKKLEQLLGQKLFDSSPHGVGLTDFGTDFISKAKELLGAHDNTLRSITYQSEKTSFRLGVTYHLADKHLPHLLNIINTEFPQYRLTLGIASSEELYAGLSRQKFDAIIVKRRVGDHTGRHLSIGKLVWMMAKDFEYNTENPLPLISLSAPCSVRQMAINALNTAKVSWQETLIGTNVFAVTSAGIACLDQGNLPDDCQIVPEHFQLPPLPETENALEAISSAQRSHRALLNAIENYFKDET